jgi:hypothetical protein
MEDRRLKNRGNLPQSALKQLKSPARSMQYAAKADITPVYF